MADPKQKQKKNTAPKRTSSPKRKSPAVNDREDWKKWRPLPLLPPTKLPPIDTRPWPTIYYDSPNYFDPIVDDIKSAWNTFTGALGDLAQYMREKVMGDARAGWNTIRGIANDAAQAFGKLFPPSSPTTNNNSNIQIGANNNAQLPPVMPPPDSNKALAGNTTSNQSSPAPSSQASVNGQAGTANTNPALTPASSQAPSPSSSQQPATTTAQSSPATGGQTSSANTNAPSPPVSSQPYSATSSQTALINANSPTPGVTTNPTQSMNTNTSFTQSGNQTYPVSGNQQQPSSGMPTTTSARSKKSPNFWDRLNAFANALGDIASAPVKAISGHTSSPQLPATMDEYYARKQATEQTVYGNISDDNNPYGGIDYVHIPYLSQEEIIASEDLAADVGRNVENLVPIIESKLRRLNPYASDEDIRNRIVNALGPIYTLMLTHAQNQRQRYELLKAVENGQTSNFTPEQLQQLQQLGLIDQNGQLIPGAHAAAQASLSATFDDDKNQYPTVFTIASSAKPSEYNRQAIADRSARTGIFDTSVFGPEYTPMYGAMPPPPVAGVKAHISRQGSMSAGLSQPQQINISSPHPRSGGSQTVIHQVNPVTLGVSMVKPSTRLDFDADKIKTGEQLLGLGVPGMKNDSAFIPHLANIIIEGQMLTNAKSKSGLTQKDIETVLTNSKDDNYRDKTTGKIDYDKIINDAGRVAKSLGIYDFWEYVRRITNPNIAALRIDTADKLANFLTQLMTQRGTDNLEGDEPVLSELLRDLAKASGNSNKPNGKPFDEEVRELIKGYQRTAAKLLTNKYDTAAWQALYKLNLFAALDANWQSAIVPSQAAAVHKTGSNLTNVATTLSTMVKAPLARIIGSDVADFLFKDSGFSGNKIVSQVMSMMINSLNAPISRAW